MKRISIDPITRLEGHGRIEIFLDDAGNVDDAFLQVPEFRGFETFCVGRPIEEMCQITSRICGVCPGAHHMAAGKAADAVYGVAIPPAARKQRELFYAAHMAHSHIAHFYILGGPDFVMGPDADPATRNVLGMIKKVGPELVTEAIRQRGAAQMVQEMLGGRATHPCINVPGGVNHRLTRENQVELQSIAGGLLEFAKKTVDVLNTVVLGNQQYVDLITNGPYVLPTYYMGMVDDRNRVNFYDGKLRVVDPTGREFACFPNQEYFNFIEEHAEPWSYVKFPYLKSLGWKGLQAGADSGIYRVAPLARLNVADGMATPLAQSEYERFFEVLGGKPVHFTLAMHWARVVELLYCGEFLVQAAADDEILSDKLRVLPTQAPSGGVGVVEAPRGTLIHQYATDPAGIVTNVNLIVATVNNYPSMVMSVRDAARSLIKNGNVNQGLLNMVEMAFRAYDPCLSCASHEVTGAPLMEVNIYDARRRLVERLTNF